MSFKHLPVLSLDDATRNFEQVGHVPYLPVQSLEDVTRNFEALGVHVPHLPVLSLEDATRDFEMFSVPTTIERPIHENTFPESGEGIWGVEPGNWGEGSGVWGGVEESVEAHPAGHTAMKIRGRMKLTVLGVWGEESGFWGLSGKWGE